jgi:hypothetical protein
MRMGKVYDAAKPSILREIPMRTRLLCMMLVSLSPPPWPPARPHRQLYLETSGPTCKTDGST